MHQQAYEWVAAHKTDAKVSVLDIGGRNINGTVRPLFPRADYTAIDLLEGDGVDVVGDVVEWRSRRKFDVVVCCEVLEHTPGWREVLGSAYARCSPGGKLIVTCAGPGRAPHSARDGGPLHPGEFYANVSPQQLERELTQAGWKDIVVDVLDTDLRAVAKK